MDELRLILIGLGVALLAGIYLWGTLTARRRRQERRDFEPTFGELDGDPLAPGDEPAGEDFLDRIRDEQAARNVGEWHEEESAPAPAEGGTPSAASGSGQSVEPVRLTQQELFDDLAGLSASREEAGPDVGNLDEMGTGEEAAAAPGTAREGAARPPGEPEPAESVVVALTVMARPGRPIDGADLLAALRGEGLEHGEMGIFHARGRGESRSTTPHFSVANAVKPGTFDPGSMEGTSTPGIALFMQVPGPRDPGEAFERMLHTGRRLAERFEAVLCDDTRSTLTGQSVNHLRERIAEVERKQRLRR